MKVLQVINNNVVSSADDDGNEVVVMGRGVGFQKKSGDEIDAAKVGKVFQLSAEHTNQFMQLVKEVPYENIRLAEKIIRYAQDILQTKLNQNIYITLTDHLNYALERKEQGIVFQNDLLWEIRRYYKNEYEVGLKALEMIQEELGVTLSEDEAGYFALHLVNAETNVGMKQATSMPGIIMDILRIVKYTMNREIDENSLYYERFVTHLKFFLQRAMRGEGYQDKEDAITETIRSSYPESYACALKIKEYVKQKLQYDVGSEEVTYLALHITRVTCND